MFKRLFGKSKKVLVIEHHPALRMAISRKLKKEGFRVFEASDGGEGIGLALANHPDAILLDLVLPVLRGEEVIHSIRTDTWGKTVPIVIISNLLDDRALREKYAISGHIVKSDAKLEDIVKKTRSAIASA